VIEFTKVHGMHTMNELFKVYLLLGHHLNVYQKFKIPKRRGPHSSSTCCRISWGIVATAAADNTAGRDRCADTEISGIEVLCRENTYVVISLKNAAESEQINIF
jgi:hypothetical protein